MSYPLLERINAPGEIKNLPASDMPALCEEIRQFLIKSVSETGGHLSSNLGVVELTVALHRVLDFPQDKLLFDVGHQCYTHKLLTGRREGFAQLRRKNGISGFPSPRESDCDAFIAGHGSAALSTAIGIARAKKLKNEPGKVVVIVGDGAFTGGMVYEGMNNVSKLNNLIVILNDNKMSISKNVGQMANYLTKLRTDPKYSHVKAHMETTLERIPVAGDALVRVLQGGKQLIRRGPLHRYFERFKGETGMSKIRLDQYLCQNGLVQSRERAKALIMSGIVFVNEQKVDKAGEMIAPDAKVEVRGHDIGYVSRGGLKLEKAMQVFPMRPDGKVCMDIGASTGGFTDCMLQNGAVKVYAVDVGYGQLAWSLRTDARVINMERTNIRNVKPEDLTEPVAFFSVDVSFISLKHIFPVADAICTPDAVGVCLVKPQFEAGREKVGKKGVVRDPATHREVLKMAEGYAMANHFTPAGLDFSPIKGPEGNIEYLM